MGMWVGTYMAPGVRAKSAAVQPTSDHSRSKQLSRTKTFSSRCYTHGGVTLVHVTGTTAVTAVVIRLLSDGTLGACGGRATRTAVLPYYIRMVFHARSRK